MKSKNLALADFVSYQTLYGSQTLDPENQETIADVASWRDTRDGKEYALICLPQPGDGSGVVVVEVTDPGDVSPVKTIRYSGQNSENTPADVKVYNDIAYVAQNFQPAYWVELEDAIDSPGNSTAGVHDDDFTTIDRVHNMFVNADHELLFLSRFAGAGEILVYDISSVPGSAPDSLGTIPQLLTGIGSRSHDLYAQTLTSTTGRVFDATLTSISVSDYSWNGTTFSVGDTLSHQFNPIRGENPDDFDNEITIKRDRVVHGTWIGQDSNYLFATVEGLSGSNSISTWVDPDTILYQRANYLSVWDIDPINPSPDPNGFRYPIQQVYEVRETAGTGTFAASYFSELSNEKCNSIHNIVTRGNGSADTAYVSYYTKGIRVLNATNPANMSEIAYYDVPGVSQYVFPVFNGTWGVDPFLPSGLILGSSSDGLYVLRLATEVSGTISSNTTWSDAILVTDHVTVQSGVTLTVNPGTTVAFADGKKLTINGSIVAEGTASQPIKFSSNKPDPGANTWNGIWVQNSSASSSFDYCTVEYSGNSIRVESTSGQVTVDHSTFENNTLGFIMQYSSPLTFQRS